MIEKKSLPPTDKSGWFPAHKNMKTASLESPMWVGEMRTVLDVRTRNLISNGSRTTTQTESLFV